MSSDFRACARCGDDGGYHLSWCTNRPTPADVTREPTGGQELRKALAKALQSATPEPRGFAIRDVLDAVLALPEVAAVIADADNWRRATTGDPTQPEPLAMQARTLLARVRELEATVGRVREIPDQLDDFAAMNDESATASRLGSAHGARHTGLRDSAAAAASLIRRALDGEPRP